MIIEVGFIFYRDAFEVHIKRKIRTASSFIFKFLMEINTSLVVQLMTWNKKREDKMARCLVLFA